MNLFNRNRANVPATQDVAHAPIANRIGASGQAMMNRATEIYRRNPKTIGGLAVLASALLLTRMKSPR